MTITTVLLDAGGVILDESRHEQVRAEVTVDLLSRVIPGYSLASYWSDVEEAVRSFCPNVYQYVFWKRSDSRTDLFDELWSSYLERFAAVQPPLKLSNGLRRELEALASEFSLGIAGKYGRELLDFLRVKGVLHLFRFPFTQEDFQLTKPDHGYFKQVAQACGATPAECVMVGDRVDNDVVPARMLGMKAVLVRMGLHRGQQPRTPSEHPDVELASVAGLGAAVRTLAPD